ncbi:NAD(P)/FAD-dependent oxidoreductase [Oceanibium sediminis]|uniref:NAD(P)/FAD-dependent oxidoreductase n=1 Tax=Oceanibium sediminis TaxID=2026339 RepID=UPI000DD3040A|nr:FAD-dependent oxidoreductase [Oceanibium sediminis]
MAGIVIIGAGHAGTQAAASLREGGYAGALTLVSADHDLPYHKPPLSKSFMKTADTPLQPLRGPSYFSDKNIDLRLGETVTAVDAGAKSVAFADGQTLAYDKLVLALGTVARQLDVPGAKLGGVVCLRTADDARRMRARLSGVSSAVVIGGGFIGLETAAMLNARGISVVVLEAAPEVLGRAVSAQTAATVREGLVASGVTVHRGATLERISGQGGQVQAVVTGDGQSIPADLVIVGIGAIPVTDLAETAGLAVENGILVDGAMRTNDPDIFAIGDCVSFPQAQIGQRVRLESVQNATDQARAVAQTLKGKPEPFTALPWFWSDIGEMKLQIAGLNHGATRQIVCLGETGVRAVFHMRDGALAAVETLNEPGIHMLSRRLLALGITPEEGQMTAGDLAGMKQLLRERVPA